MSRSVETDFTHFYICLKCFTNCFLRRRLQKTTNSFPAFTLNGVKTLAKVVDVYDGDTFKACMEHDGVMRK